MLTIVALPVTCGRLCAHFGHSDKIAFFEVNRNSGSISCRWDRPPPVHETGLLLRWLREQGAGIIIANGMESGARDLFAQAGIEVLVGAPVKEPEKLVRDWLAGELEQGANACDQ